MIINKTIPVLMILGLLLSLTACWDQRPLREQSLILAMGYDKGDEDGLKKTVTYPKETNEKENGGQESNSMTVTGTTVNDTEKKMDKRIVEKFDRSKARVILFGADLAKEGIFSTLDSVYRDFRGPLYAKVAIFDGETEDALHVESNQAPMVSDIYAELLNSAAEAGITKNENVQLSCPIILTKGRDLVLPYLSLHNDEVVVNGIALFHHDKMTGTLNEDEATMFLLLAKKLTKNSSFNFKVNDDEEDPYKQYVDISIPKNKRHIKLTVTDDDVRAKIDITLNVEVDEYAADHLQDKKQAKELSKKLEKNLHELANVTISKSQEANSDILGLGEKVKAYHYETWKKIDWSHVYPELQIDVDFTVNIVRHGIIN